MKSQEEFEGALSGYFGIDKRTWAIFFGLVFGVVIVVTCIYVAIFGFDSWKTSMAGAGSMLLSNFDPQAGAGGTVGQGGQMLQGVAPAAVPAFQGGTQYTCPACGAVGLPIWNQVGTPTCPTCGALMVIAGNAGANGHLMAAP